MNVLKQYQRFSEIQSDRREIFELLDRAGQIQKTDNTAPAQRSFQKSMGIDPMKEPVSLKVVMVLRVIYPNRGGVTSALRILNDLEKRGCQTTVAIASEELSIVRNAQNVKKCMPDFHGEVKPLEMCESELYDVCIATGWRTVYAAARLTGYKIYFVQDYEPCFEALNDYSELARETYRMGFHIISLGKWNLEQIRKNVPDSGSIRMDAVDFPYDRSEYPPVSRRYDLYRQKKRIRIACYLKFTGRRIPYICEYLLSHAKEDLAKDGIETEIVYFGVDPRNHFKDGKNLGKLTRAELNRLYEKSDFGMVASMSNISLVPYEMLATGLPLIEFQNGSYPYFLGEDTALLIDFDYHTLANGIRDLLAHPDRLEHMHEKAEERLAHVSWQHTCEQFWNILKEGLK